MGQLPKFKTENEDLNWDEVSVLYVSYETGLVALPDTKPGDLSFTFLQSSFTSVSKLNILFLKIRKKKVMKMLQLSFKTFSAYWKSSSKFAPSNLSVFTIPLRFLANFWTSLFEPIFLLSELLALMFVLFPATYPVLDRGSSC